MDPWHVRRMNCIRRGISKRGNGFAWHHERVGWMIIEGLSAWLAVDGES